ncbi:DNA-binding protein [Paraburkholderia phenazinium]|nr:DNA-binding protein [Paraburkholderia phenazinium]
MSYNGFQSSLTEYCLYRKHRLWYFVSIADTRNRHVRLRTSVFPHTGCRCYLVNGTNKYTAKKWTVGASCRDGERNNATLFRVIIKVIISPALYPGHLSQSVRPVCIGITANHIKIRFRAIISFMSRAPSNSPEAVRATVIALLAEAGQPAPASTEEFRRHVSVRRVRARLGGGDTTALGRTINEIEVELVAAGRAHLRVPDIPPHVSDLMRGLWTAALDAQTHEILKIQQAAAESVENAETERDNARARVDLLKVELDDLRQDLSTRDETVGELRARLAETETQLEAANRNARTMADRLDEMKSQRDEAHRAYQERVDALRLQFDGLGRQLRLETDTLRQGMVSEKAALEGGLTRASQVIESQKQIIEELQADRQKLRSELAGQRDADSPVR